MSKSYRDKRAHRARNPKKYFGENVDRDTLFKEGIHPTKNYPSIFWSIAGKRRRNSTRKSNQKTKQIIHQKQRAKEKEELRLNLNYLRFHEGNVSIKH